MAVPTITLISPSTLWTAGQLLTITGTNFKLWTIPGVVPYVLPAPTPTVKVTVGGVTCANVSVKSATSLTFSAPSHDVGTAAVVVSNLTSGGTVVPGEVSGSSTITYKRPVLTDTLDLERVHSALLLLLRQQVLDNTLNYVSVDYAETTFEATMLGKLPALIVSGPTIVESDNPYVQNTNTEVGTFDEYQAPEVYDLMYDLTGVAANEKQLIALQAILARFFRKTRKLTVYRDSTDLSKGTVDFDIEKRAGEAFRMTTTPNKQDVRSFDVSFKLLGVTSEGLAGFPGENLVFRGGVADDINIVSVSID